MQQFRFAVLMLLAFTAATFAQTKTKNVDPSGTWRWESDNNGVTQKHELKLRMDANGKVHGIYDGMLDNVHSSSGTMKGDKLKLEFEVETPDGNEFEAEYDVTIKGDKAEGKIMLSSDEGSVDMDWNAERTLEMADVQGVWDLVLDIDGEEREATLDVSGKNGKYKAFYKDAVVGKIEAGDVKIKDNQLMFAVSASHDGVDLVANSTVKPVGAKLSGKSLVDMDGNTIEIPIEGKLQEANPIGTWNLALNADGEEMNPRLVVNVKGGKLDGVFQTEDMGDFEVKRLKIDGHKIVFHMDGELDGADAKAKVDAKMMGDMIKGVMELDLDGQDMELPLSGKRMKK